MTRAPWEGSTKLGAVLLRGMCLRGRLARAVFTGVTYKERKTFLLEIVTKELLECCHLEL